MESYKPFHNNQRVLLYSIRKSTRDSNFLIIQLAKNCPEVTIMSDRIKTVLKGILDKFEEGDIPKAIAYTTFPMANIPSAKWSFLNKLLMVLAGTLDARGFRQWELVKRQVKGGRKAFYIIVPLMVKEETEQNDETSVLIKGFRARPVFRVEDTGGAPLEYENLELPELPLMEKAKEWGISVKAIPGNYNYYGYFSNDRKEIAMATKEESVFFHELSHAAHTRITKRDGKRPSEQWEKELVAELCAAALCRIVGKTSKHLGNSYQYIRHYSENAGLSPIKGCLNVLTTVEQILSYILSSQSVFTRSQTQ